MVHDAFGKGQFVQHTVLQNERAATLSTAVDEFKTNNPVWTRIQCVIIDKDFTEIAVLKTALPSVQVLLCHFHVIKYLREQLAFADYGLSPWQKSQIRNLVPLMVYAKTKRIKNRSYVRHALSIRSVSAGSRHSRALLSEAEMENNMVSNGAQTISGHLATHLAPHLHHQSTRQSFTDATNNRLESSCKQLKDTMHSFMGLDECVASMMCYQSRNERRFVARVSKIGMVVNAKFERKMSLVANLVSEHACELIFEQYSYTLSDREKYSFYEAVPGIYFVKNKSEEDDALNEPSVEYSVNKQKWEGSCLFISTRLLPCHHVFFLRKALQLELLIPTQLLPSRWLLSSLRSETPVLALPGKSFSVTKVLRQERQPWDANWKFREAHALASSISQMMSMGMPQPKAAIQALQEVARLFKRGEIEDVAKWISHR
ncbi:unnamed protein product [Phytophthora fragariaefolia]|uniref:Unnamed protein product n=1 Tax=Phytophthora fragariaefolia TaxID=1490495 RepID=A0A9W6XG45_9STRA|nr:unnamed protein product [Phytophthora fragariaefolia]